MCGASPDLAPGLSRSYSRLRMTSLPGQGLGKPQGGRETAREHTSSSSTWYLCAWCGPPRPPALSPVSPGRLSPLWWLIQRGSAARLSSSKSAVLCGGNSSCSRARSPVYRAFCSAMSRHSSGER